MTQTETRQLGIEFERRIQLMDPLFEFANKIDTDTIYSILNEYLIKYVKQMYMAQQQIQDNEKSSVKASDVLRPLLITTIKDAVSDKLNNDAFSTIFNIPDNYWLYERSKSACNKTYNSKTKTVVLNKYSTQHDIDASLFESANAGAIIRHPLITIENDIAKVHHDCYTDIFQLSITYYKKPAVFDVTTTPCELPIQCFDELVDGAIQLFMMTYKYGLGLAANDRKDNAIKKNLRKLTNDDNNLNND